MSDDMKVSKGLKFPVVALHGVVRMPATGEDEQGSALVFYVAATRATQRLVGGLGVGGGLTIALSAVGSKSKWTDFRPFAIQRQLSKFIDHSSRRP